MDAASTPRPHEHQVEADHRQDPADAKDAEPATGPRPDPAYQPAAWSTVVTVDGQPAALLRSQSLEGAHDAACAWVNEHLGEHVPISHLWDGQPCPLLTVAAYERVVRIPRQRTGSPDPPLDLPLHLPLDRQAGLAGDRAARPST